ncbi:hypothetical protein AB0H83_12970 [Dactylosporangium sp. NPDC050688]|uniref:hypothetical protein n=1 Tax=Dactylosporangium sp. NPDC050688 TaxID=3157217 RepID=UPI0033D7EE58
MAGVFLLSGVFRSVGFTGYNTLQFADVPAAQMNGATTLSSTVVQLANGLGIALAALGVRAVDAVSGPGAGGGLLGYRVALVALAAVAALSIVAPLRLPARRGGARAPPAPRPAFTLRPGLPPGQADAGREHDPAARRPAAPRQLRLTGGRGATKTAPRPSPARRRLPPPASKALTVTTSRATRSRCSDGQPA